MAVAPGYQTHPAPAERLTGKSRKPAQHRKLGRGLADVSPLFNEAELAPRGRFIALVNPLPAISCPFLACNLAICMARTGARVLVVDRSPIAPDVGFLFGVDPPYSPFQPIDIPASESPLPPTSPLTELYLSRFFADALIHSRNGEVDTVLYCMAGSIDDLPARVTSVLVPLFPDLHKTEENAEFINDLYSLSGGVEVGILFYRASSAVEAETCYQKLSQSVRPGPARPLFNYGLLPDDPAIERSILERSPLAITRTQSLPYRAIAQLSRHILKSFGWDQFGPWTTGVPQAESRPC